MKKRSEKRLMWFALFILLGPIAITSYLYSRDPLLATKGAVNKAYDVVDHIAIPWLIYLSLLPFFWMVTLFFLSFFFDGFADGRFTLHDHVTEALFWVFLMVLFVVFFIILPLLILAIIIKVILYFVQKKSSA